MIFATRPSARDEQHVQLDVADGLPHPHGSTRGVGSGNTIPMSVGQVADEHQTLLGALGCIGNHDFERVLAGGMVLTKAGDSSEVRGNVASSAAHGSPAPVPARLRPPRTPATRRA